MSFEISKPGVGKGGAQSIWGRGNSTYEGLKAETSRKTSSMAAGRGRQGLGYTGSCGQNWCLADIHRSGCIDGLWSAAILIGRRCWTCN